MKKISLLLLLALFLFSCKKDDQFPSVETITHGHKWSLQIGSPPSEVYEQLRELGQEKGFSDVAIVYRKPYSAPEELQDRLNFYRSLTLQNNTGRTWRVVIRFDRDQVRSIETGGGLLDEVSSWPDGAPDKATIRLNDPVAEIYDKLLAIYQIPAYANYQIILPDKSLEKPFDPDMARYNEWRFTFSTDVKPGKEGTSSVILYFSQGKLDKISHEYREATVYY